MSAKPLTAAEAKWVKDLQTLLNKCPSKRMVAFTIGDPMVVIYDSSFSGEIDDIMNRSNKDVCQVVTALGAELATVTFPFPVESTAG
ncbi:hypothetical protein Ahp2_59 [Aeromonas phage Ahp2]|nr:hypothetical protein Ahp2_59 [Aeromonas phage Ahp2]